MTSEVGRRPAPVAPAITGRRRLRIYGLRQRLRQDPPRLAPGDARSSAVLSALLLIGVSQAIVTEFDTPASRAASSSTVVAAVPPILQGLAGQAGQRRDARRLPPVQVRDVLPAHRQPLVDPRPVRRRSPAEARRGSLEFVAATPIAPAPDRAREAVRPPDRPGDRDARSSSSRCVIVGAIGPRAARRRDLASTARGRLRDLARPDRPRRRLAGVRARASSSAAARPSASPARSCSAGSSSTATRPRSRRSRRSRT